MAMMSVEMTVKQVSRTSKRVWRGLQFLQRMTLVIRHRHLHHRGVTALLTTSQAHPQKCIRHPYHLLLWTSRQYHHKQLLKQQSRRHHRCHSRLRHHYHSRLCRVALRSSCHHVRPHHRQKTTVMTHVSQPKARAHRHHRWSHLQRLPRVILGHLPSSSCHRFHQNQSHQHVLSRQQQCPCL